MKVAICYIFPQINLQKYLPLAQRFAMTYMANPPGDCDHTLHVISNGYPIQKPHEALFGPLPVTHMTHNNFGKDIGAFQIAALKIQCDLLVCFGAHVYFWNPGWLDRMVNAYVNNGPTLYGAWAFHQPSHHIRTTAFWMPPMILNAYPYQVGDPQRYDFEHGANSIVVHTKKLGFEPLMVTNRGVFEEKDWRHVERDECLFFDQHTESIGYK